MVRSLAGLAAAVGVASGCGDAAVDVRLIFPSERAFLVSALGRIEVYDGEGSDDTSPDAICRSLSVSPPAPPAGVKPIATTGLTDVCALHDGQVRIDDVGVGRRVVFVETVDHDSKTIVRGCTVVDIDDSSSSADGRGAPQPLTVQLATLPAFPTAQPACDTIEDKCKEKVECKPGS